MAEVNHHLLFREDSWGRWTPRSLFFDQEVDQLDALMVSSLGDLVEPRAILLGSDYTDRLGPNAARSNEKHRWIFDFLLEDRVRYMTEQCDSTPDFLINSSQHGCVGGAASCGFLETMAISFSKSSKIRMSVIPAIEESGHGPMHTINNIINLGFKCSEDDTLDIWVDNVALANILERLDRQNGEDLSK